MNITKLLFTVISVFFLSQCAEPLPENTREKLAIWTEGHLDIHHINTANGDATFFIFPDGTTMLFDLGGSKAPLNHPEYFYLETNKQMTAAQIVANYIAAVHPNGKKTTLDYALISHFHPDHYGKINTDTKKMDSLGYYVTGITELEQYIPITKVIDRAYPEYDIPKGLRDYNSADMMFDSYLKYIEERDKNGKVNEQLKPGIKNQIVLKSDLYPEFEVRNLKSNLVTWTGIEDETEERMFDFTQQMKNRGFSENPLSLAIQINYGDFDYFTGGDLTGFDWRNVFDTETPIAKATGEIDAIALNHHGWHDATNAYFMNTLHPNVVVSQSRHDPHFQFNPLEKVLNINADFYTNNLHEGVFNLFSEDLKKLVKGQNGHIVIRVSPQGSEYYVYVVEDGDFNLNILNKVGPYISEK